MDKSGNDERKRRNKEAYNRRMYSSLGSSKKNMNRSFSKGGVDVGLVDNPIDFKEEEDIKRRLDINQVIFLTRINLVDNLYYYYNRDGKVLCGEHFPDVVGLFPSDIRYVDSINGNGALITTTEPCILFRGSVFVVKLCVPEHIWVDDVGNSHRSVGGERFVYLPLFERLREQFPQIVQDTSTIKAIYAYSLKHVDLTLNEELALSTSEYYIMHRHYIMYQHMLQPWVTEKMSNNGGFLVTSSGKINRNMAHLVGNRVRYGMPDSVSNVLVQDGQFPVYDSRSDWSIISGSIGGRPFYSKFQPHPTYTFLPAFTDGRKKVRTETVFLRLHDAHIIQYGESVLTLYAAMQRMIGVRDEEEFFRAEARRLAWSLVDKMPKHCQLFMESMRYPKPPSGYFNNHLNEFRISFLSDVVKDIYGSCGPTFVQYFSDKLTDVSSWAYNSVLQSVYEIGGLYKHRSSIASIPHVKKNLRRAMVEKEALHTVDGLMVRRLKVSLKRESAKHGKVPRVYMAYGSGCMYANELPEYLKVCLNGCRNYLLYDDQGQPFTLELIVMTKLDEVELGTYMLKLRDAMDIPNHMCVLIHSDDSVYSGNVRGQRFMYNVDVKSNDSSQDAPAFLVVYYLLSAWNQSFALGLAQQCLLPFVVSNPECSDEYFTMQFNTPFEGSGTVLTSVLNHVGSMLIACSVFSELVKGRLTINESIIHGASLIGHSVTLDECEIFEDMTFLKRFPCVIGEVCIPVLVPGAIIRNFGKVDDALRCDQLGLTPAHFSALSNAERMDMFLSAQINGYKWQPSYSIITALRERFSHSTSVTEACHASVKIFDHLGDFTDYDVESCIKKRYRLGDEELATFTQLIRDLRVGDQISERVARCILYKDYDIPM